MGNRVGVGGEGRGGEEGKGRIEYAMKIGYSFSSSSSSLAGTAPSGPTSTTTVRSCLSRSHLFEKAAIPGRRGSRGFRSKVSANVDTPSVLI